MTATGFSRNGFVGNGRDTQSKAFFSASVYTVEAAYNLASLLANSEESAQL